VQESEITLNDVADLSRLLPQVGFESQYISFKSFPEELDVKLWLWQLLIEVIQNIE
jgi:hypothetical protein